MLAAMRRASSLVSGLAATPTGLVLEIDIGERVAVGAADDEAVLAEVLVSVVDGPLRREAVGRHGSHRNAGRLAAVGASEWSRLAGAAPLHPSFDGFDASFEILGKLLAQFGLEGHRLSGVIPQLFS
jgi:hypothetical protein